MTRCSTGSARQLLTALLILVLAVALSDGLAQDSYPNRLIRIIVPTAPGGPSDISARLIAQELSKMPYDALRDFAPITQTLVVPNLISCWCWTRRKCT